MQQQVQHQVSSQFSPHHHPMTPNPQQHPMTMQTQQHHMSPYSSQPPTQSQQQSQSIHHPHSQPTQHSPTIVVQPITSQFSPSSVHHHQLTLTTPTTPNTTGHQSPTNDPTKRSIQIQKPPQLLVKHEPMSYDEQSIKTEGGHDELLIESTNTNKIRADPLLCKFILSSKQKKQENFFFFLSRTTTCSRTNR